MFNLTSNQKNENLSHTKILHTRMPKMKQNIPEGDKDMEQEFSECWGKYKFVQRFWKTFLALST